MGTVPLLLEALPMACSSEAREIGSQIGQPRQSSPWHAVSCQFGLQRSHERCGGCVQVGLWMGSGLVLVMCGAAGGSVSGSGGSSSGTIQEWSGLMVILVRLVALVCARACSGVTLPKANLPRMRADLPGRVCLLIGCVGGGGGMVSAMLRLLCIADWCCVSSMVGVSQSELVVLCSACRLLLVLVLVLVSMALSVW